MAWRQDTPQGGYPPITDTSTTEKVPVGTVITAHDDDSGGAGEFIYLKGVASTVAGSVVTYNATTHDTTLAVVGAAKSLPVAIAMSANVASQYGWYQIGGVATTIKTTATSFAAGAALGTTGGEVIAAATSNAVAGMVVAAIASGNTATCTVMLQRPVMSET